MEAQGHLLLNQTQHYQALIWGYSLLWIRLDASKKDPLKLNSYKLILFIPLSKWQLVYHQTKNLSVAINII